MNRRLSAYFWFLIGAAALAALWIAVVTRAPWTDWIGRMFLISPLLATFVTLGAVWRRDRVTAWCLLGIAGLLASSFFTG